MSDRTQRAAERLLARLVPGWTPRIVRLDAVERERQRLLALIGEPELDEASARQIRSLQDALTANVREATAIDERHRAEVERLRGLLAEALTSWDAAQDWQISSAAGMRIGEIRREAGLS